MLERQGSATSFLLGAREPPYCCNVMPGPFLFIALEYNATLGFCSELLCSELLCSKLL